MIKSLKFLAIVLFIVISFWDIVSCSFLDYNDIFVSTAKYAALPGLIMGIVYMYKEVNTNPAFQAAALFQRIGAFIMCSIGIGLFTIFFSSGIVSIINRTFGKQEKIVIEGEITDMWKDIGNNTTPYSIDVINNSDQKEYHFGIDKQTFAIVKHQTYFKKEMNKGCLGFIYAN